MKRCVILIALGSLFASAEPSSAYIFVKAGYGEPERLFGGVMMVNGDSRWQLDFLAGLGGGKIAGGPSFMLGDSPSSSGLGIGAAWNLTPKIVFMRSWGEPVGVAPDRNLLGAELEVAVNFIFGFHVGALHEISGSNKGNTVLSWGVRIAWPIT